MRPQQGFLNQGYNGQGYTNQGFTNQGYPNQGFNQGFNQGYNSQGFNQGFGNQGFGGQGFNNQGFNSQGFNNSGYNQPYVQGLNSSGHHHHRHHHHHHRPHHGYTGFTPVWHNNYGLNVQSVMFRPNCVRCSGNGVYLSRRGLAIPCRSCYRSHGYCTRCYNTGMRFKTGRPCYRCQGGRNYSSSSDSSFG
ncbi:unnamed protein product [Sphagnum balticum]